MKTMGEKLYLNEIARFMILSLLFFRKELNLDYFQAPMAYGREL